MRTAPQSLGTVTLDSEGMFGTVPQWLLGSWNVCITAYNGEYGVELGFNPCETGYVSATDAATYGVPSAADWARRDEEALHGMVNNDPTRGTAHLRTRRRHADVHRQVDNIECVVLVHTKHGNDRR